MFKLVWQIIKLAFLIAVLSLIFNQISSRFFLSSLLRLSLGVPVEVGSAQVDFINAEIRFQDVEIWNPVNFPPGVMIYIREVSLDTELSRLFNRHPSFSRIEVDVDNIRLMKSMDTPLNALSTKFYKNDTPGPQFGVDEFVLSVNRASYRDEASAGSGDLTKDVDLRRMKYEKVKGLRDMFDILNWETLKKMGLVPLAGRYLDAIRDDLDPNEGRTFSQPRSANWR